MKDNIWTCDKLAVDRYLDEGHSKSVLLLGFSLLLNLYPDEFLHDRIKEITKKL